MARMPPAGVNLLLTLWLVWAYACSQGPLEQRQSELPELPPLTFDGFSEDVQKEIEKLEKELVGTRKEMAGYLKELGYGT